MNHIGKRHEYEAMFPHFAVSHSIRALALKEALDIRKFEIDLYWRRTTYFWTLLASIFVGYFATEELSNTSDQFLLIISSLGITFSFAWYCVNRGSKYWQLNWERHVDMLEEPITGPLHKTVINNKQFRRRDLKKPYPFSVSKINQILSCYVLLIWSVLWIRSIFKVLELDISTLYYSFFMIGFTLLSIYSIFKHGKTSFGRTKIDFVTREFDAKKQEFS